MKDILEPHDGIVIKELLISIDEVQANLDALINFPNNGIDSTSVSKFRTALKGVKASAARLISPTEKQERSLLMATQKKLLISPQTAQTCITALLDMINGDIEFPCTNKNDRVLSMLPWFLALSELHGPKAMATEQIKTLPSSERCTERLGKRRCTLPLNHGDMRCITTTGRMFGPGIVQPIAGWESEATL